MTGDGWLDWSEYIKLFVGLLSLANPIGKLPIVFALTQNHSPKEKIQFFRSSALTYIITLLIFTLIGGHILKVFGITTAALKVAGGILFLFYGLSMLDVIRLPQSYEGNSNQSKPNGIVPVGIPMLAGPGSITKVIIYAELHSTLAYRIPIMIVITAVGALVYGLFRVLLAVGKGPDKTVMLIVVKVMGLILAGIAAEFMLEGVVEFLQNNMI